MYFGLIAEVYNQGMGNKWNYLFGILSLLFAAITFYIFYRYTELADTTRELEGNSTFSYQGFSVTVIGLILTGGLAFIGYRFFMAAQKS